MNYNPEDALYIFRKNFPITKKINVQADYIGYELTKGRSNDELLQAARSIIEDFHLPLTARLEISVSSAYLYIQYVEKRIIANTNYSADFSAKSKQ